MRVSQDGGAPEQVTVVDTAGGETDHVYPQVLPDARGVLFTILRGVDLELADVGVHDLETGERRVQVRGVTARYIEPGYLVFVRGDGTLAAVAFDTDRLAATGEAFDLAEGVAVRQNGAVDLTVSDEGTVLYLTGTRAPEQYSSTIARPGLPTDGR